MTAELNLWQAIKAVMEGQKVCETDENVFYMALTPDGKGISWYHTLDNLEHNNIKVATLVSKTFKIYTPPIDWFKVPVDTPVRVSNSDTHIWEERYFAMYLPESDLPFVTFNGGSKQSKSTGLLQWKLCELCTEDER